MKHGHESKTIVVRHSSIDNESYDDTFPAVAELPVLGDTAVYQELKAWVGAENEMFCEAG
jgi:hypothetical protein